MNEDLREFLRLLNSHGVEYLLIGGHAFGFHATPRFTEDVDLWLARTRENAKRLEAVLFEFGLPLGEGGADEFLKEDRMVRLGRPPNRIDLLNSATGLSFPEAWKRRVFAKIEGVEVPVVSLEDLIRSKKATGRPKDLRDAEELESL